MSRTIGPMIAAGASLSIPNARRLIAGVDAVQFARLARCGGVIVQSNHPAWVYGHLALYPSRVLTALGQPAAIATPPDGFEALFKNGAACVDDPDGSIYPPMERITALFFDAYEAAFAAVAAAEDGVLLGENPSPGRMRELFPTLGAMFMFYLGGHVQMHLGQVSAWRRMIGLPPA